MSETPLTLVTLLALEASAPRPQSPFIERSLTIVDGSAEAAASGLVISAANNPAIQAGFDAWAWQRVKVVSHSNGTASLVMLRR